ncbi:hypothetical protein CLV24_11440 [Pontibacter ummariensis]|uniref:Uncharacterized protein n=1 Tax=Pontibacter ummariensis TaxID=1610492 RepID=A0A239HLN3_9BACT|nr:hypothetical protein [Pontibacter ummariensis]PRY10312.1 hypothetical protein CLV24_11440 [Pontibacter ummariensis]SNS81998.1 hypothetical protein SAMN06296052_11440 [Pontibacter ummariensis]
MVQVATIEQNKFGVVVCFPPRADISRQVYKLLISGGFTRAGCMSFNHWMAEATNKSIAQAGQIVALYNTPQPKRKQLLYPRRKTR